MLTNKVRLFPPDIPTGYEQVPYLSTLVQKLREKEKELLAAKEMLAKLEEESVIQEKDKLVSDKQLTELQLQLQELRDAMIEFAFL